MRLTLVLFPLVTAVTMFLIRPLVFCRLSAKLSHPFSRYWRVSGSPGIALSACRAATLLKSRHLVRVRGGSSTVGARLWPGPGRDAHLPATDSSLTLS